MKRLDSSEIMDYLDGTLSDKQRAAVEAHLAAHDEDRELVATMRAAMGALHELDAAEPLRVSEDFWPKLRDKLPAQPPRRTLMTRLGTWLWPQGSRSARSMRVAVMAALVAMLGLWFGPQQTVAPTQAEIPVEARAFIQQASELHSAYVSTQPLGGTAATPGVAGSAETADEEDEAKGATQ